MNQIEKEMMLSMIDILNEASKRPILTEEQYTERLQDLQQFEEELNFMFLNSPSCRDKISSIIKVRNILKDSYKKCHDVESIIKFADNKEMLIYPNLVGDRVFVSYVNGIMSNFMVNNAVINLREIKNIPYKINKDSIYTVCGVLYNLKFYVTDTIEVGSNISNNLEEAEKIGFDAIPHWVATLNPKKLQSSIDYVFNYAKEEKLMCDGVVFRFNDVSYCKDGIVYEMLK